MSGTIRVDMQTAYELFELRNKVDGLSAHTQRNYSYVLRRFQTWFGDKTEVDTNVLRAYFLMLQDENLSLPTLATHHRGLKTFFGFLVKEGHMDKNPVEGIRKPKIDKLYPYVLENAQFQALLKAPNRSTFEGLRNYTMLLTFLDTGLRVTELTKLNMQDLNLSNRSLTVVGKGNKERTVYMGRNVTKALSKYLTRRGFHPYEDAVFVTRAGDRLNARNVHQIVARLGKRAGITGVRCSPHTLRHTFATVYIRNGGDPFSLQRLLGHADIQTVMVYVHMVGKDLREAQAKYSPMDRLHNN